MKNFFSFLSRSSQKKILCLDGGGVRTIAALVFLKKLESENYKFEFKLLTNVSQDQVLSELDNAHIALNEFFAYVPGIFGIEALEGI